MRRPRTHNRRGRGVATGLAGLVLVLLVGLGACDGPSGDDGPPFDTSYSPTSLQDDAWPDCLGDPPTWPTVEGQVRVPMGTAACRLEFRSIARLDGSDETVLPRPPVAAGPGDLIVTATFQPGVLAVWDPDGSLLHSFGRGDGEGPGEFSNPSGLVVSPDSVVHVFTARPQWHQYALNGEFIRTASLPSAVGPRTGVLTADGALVTVVRLVETGLQQAGIFVWDGEGAHRVGEVPSDDGTPPIFGFSPSLGFWSTDSRELDLVRYGLPDGAEALRLALEGAWTSESSSQAAPPRISRLALDDRGLIWYLANLPGLDAPDGEMPPASSMEELRSTIGLYRDNVAEVVTLDGRLVASKRYTDPAAIPLPITADRWYLDDLMGSIVIKEPVLVDP